VKNQKGRERKKSCRLEAKGESEKDKLKTAFSRKGLVRKPRE